MANEEIDEVIGKIGDNETPETDEQVWEAGTGYDMDTDYVDVVNASFARRLERQRNQAFRLLAKAVGAMAKEKAHG